MTIDTSGKWWVEGTTDIAEYLEGYASEGYEVHDFRLARCKCGSISFLLDADDDEGVARRTCTACGSEHLICDSEEFWDEAQPERWACTECGSEAANIGVGFSIYPGRGGVRWLYVGERCAPVAFWDASPAGKWAPATAWTCWTKSSFEVP
ncbi:hypothetical protein NKH47_16240 [Mesorhizobium sp. M1060]|uniref:hypothetical protein n=1 Tax=Mesorhizobium sp. M1060 TaxID=2957052 RepID=UPI00333D8DF6